LIDTVIGNKDTERNTLFWSQNLNRVHSFLFVCFSMA